MTATLAAGLPRLAKPSNAKGSDGRGAGGVRTGGRTGCVRVTAALVSGPTARLANTHVATAQSTMNATIARVSSGSRLRVCILMTLTPLDKSRSHRDPRSQNCVTRVAWLGTVRRRAHLENKFHLGEYWCSLDRVQICSQEGLWPERLILLEEGAASAIAATAGPGTG